MPRVGDGDDALLRPKVLIAYCPVLGHQRMTFFVVPVESISQHDIRELRALHERAPEETSHDNVSVALGKRLDSILAGNSRPLHQLVHEGEALVESIELKHAIISTSIVR